MNYTQAQIDRANVVWKIFSVHRERRLSKADENTAGKNMTV